MKEAAFNDRGQLIAPDGQEPFQIVGPDGNPIAPFILAQSFVAVSGAADTNENTLATIILPANALGPRGHVEIEAHWAMTNNVNVKTLRTKFGGTAIVAAAGASLAALKTICRIANRNLTNSQFTDATTLSAAATVGAVGTAAIDTTSPVLITITAQKATGGDTVTLEGYIVRVHPTPTVS